MNSRFVVPFLLLLACFLTSSCGVKNDPIPPGRVYLPSVVDQYTKAPVKPDEKKKAETDKKKSE
ncbi:MAG: hypothetical protein GY909_11375 [Oligoflexia bacterium]|nr:hypothetical protein [Oligoflexia bacterium]